MFRFRIKKFELLHAISKNGKINICSNVNVKIIYICNKNGDVGVRISNIGKTNVDVYTKKISIS